MHCHIGQKGKINRGWEICGMKSDKYTRNENAAEICVKLIGLKWVAAVNNLLSHHSSRANGGAEEMAQFFASEQKGHN